MKYGMFTMGLACMATWPAVCNAQGYFQQRADITIDVRLDDERHMLHGYETLEYTNNAPGALDTLWMHLWPNAYRDRNTALNRQMVRDGNLALHFASAEDRGWIDSLDFKAEGSSLIWGHHPEHADIAWIVLPEALGSGRSITITTPFRVKIPDSRFSRLGHTGQAYHITQWYPKPAVYDQDGWHAMPYLTIGEFYSEFGRFDVSITLPANYVVGATGLLQDDPQEEAWMDLRATLTAVADRSVEANAFPPSDARTKTLRFVQDDVHDFAWFADKRFIVRKGSVTLERSGRTVETWALFTPRNARLWEQVGIESLNESLKFYSQWVGDYPYDACTAVDGTISAGGGMEYPMITIIGNMGSAESLDNVIAHEVGHNWFYGILGSNERDHAWMDEGMNSFVELQYMRSRYPDGGLDIGLPGLKKLTAHIEDRHSFQNEAFYRLNARRNLDQPIETCAHDYTQINYGGIVYGKTALVFDQLFAYLGEEVFDRCMHAYFEEWKFRHPGPGDVRRVFERESGQDLSWVFDELIGTSRKVDVRALRLKGDRLTYRSNTRTAFTFPVTGRQGGTVLGTEWFEGGHGRNTIRLPWPEVDRVRIDAGARTLDIDRRNNEVRSRGLFRRWAKPELQWLFGLEKDDRRSIYWTPLAAGNGHDGFQLGLGLTNTIFPSQRTEWVLAPLYGLGSERFGGAGRIAHHFDRIESRLFQNIHLELSARSASTYHDHHEDAWYAKLAPAITFDLKRDPLTRPWQHAVALRGVGLQREQRADPPDGPSFTSSRTDTYVELSHLALNTSTLSPTRIAPTVTYHEDFLRFSLELLQALTYNEKKDQLRLRGFAGMFLHVSDVGLTDRLQAWQLSWGAEDMLFDHAYLTRGGAPGLPGRQYNVQQGAFKTPFLQGGSDSWIAALNLELDLPVGLPISLFASTGFAPITQIAADGRRTEIAGQYHEAGIGMQVIRGVMEVWVPLIVSQRIADEEAFLDRGIADRIRIILALEKIDPTRALRRLQP